MSKKVLMLLGTILGNILVLVLVHFWPDLPSNIIQWAIAGISSTGIGGVLGQGFADGLSKGLTSSKVKTILENESTPES